MLQIVFVLLVLPQATNGPRYVVGCRRQLEKAKLKPGTRWGVGDLDDEMFWEFNELQLHVVRVALDMTTLTIMRYLPREVRVPGSCCAMYYLVVAVIQLYSVITWLNLYSIFTLHLQVDPLVYNMSHEDPGDVSYNAIGGLGEQIRELREVGELS